TSGGWRWSQGGGSREPGDEPDRIPADYVKIQPPASTVGSPAACQAAKPPARSCTAGTPIATGAAPAQARGAHCRPQRTTGQRDRRAAEAGAPLGRAPPLDPIAVEAEGPRALPVGPPLMLGAGVDEPRPLVPQTRRRGRIEDADAAAGGGQQPVDGWLDGRFV